MVKWKYEPAEDDSVDPQWVLLTDDGKDTHIAIQDCRSYGGGYAVNEYNGEGESFSMLDVGTAGSLRAAQKIALERLAKRPVTA